MSEPLKLSDLSTTDIEKLDVVKRYTNFAPVYNQSVEDWGYQCYRTAANILQSYVSQEQPVLDAGCGTGLVGQALNNLGYQNITGIDISSEMLAQAKATDHYSELLLHDLSKTPYPFSESSFFAVSCIGVFSLIADPMPVLQEFCRLVQPRGYLVFTQQEILFKKYDYAKVLADFEERGQLRRESISDPVSYLPKREGYHKRKAIYCVYQVI